MPVALLLQNTLRSLSLGARAMGTWGRMVALEELLLERTRGAFMVSWFGTRFPTEGFALRISFANLDALRLRYEAVRSATGEGAPGGLNLTEPGAGMVGMLTGILSSPFPALLVGIAAAVLGEGWLTKLLGALHAASLGTLTGAVGVLAFPLAIVGILVLAIDDPRVGQVYGLMGALAELLTAARIFIDQLLGPPEQVRNPLVRAVLGVFDRMAAIFALLLGLAALIFARLQPLILPLVDQAIALYRLFQAVMGVIEVAVFDLIFRLGWLSEGQGSPLAAIDAVVAALMQMATVLSERIGELMDTVVSGITDLGLSLSARVLLFLTAASEALRRAVENHPLGQVLNMAIAIMPAVISALRAIGTMIMASLRNAPVIGGLLSGSGSSSSSASGGGVTDWLYRQGPPLPPVPTAPAVGAVEVAVGGRPALSASLDTLLATAEGSPTYVFLTDEAMAELARMRSRPDPFRLERLALRDVGGGSAAQQLADLRAEQLPLRALLAAIVERVLPPAAAPYVRELDDLFRLVDRELFGLPAGTAPRRELPVRALAESDRLRVEVGRLRVRVAGADTAAARAWADSFGAALRAQSYIAANTPEG